MFRKDNKKIEKVQDKTGKMPSAQVNVDKPVKKKDTPKWFVWIKDILLGFVNVVFIVGIVIILNKIPSIANQLRSVRTLDISPISDDLSLQKFEIEKNKSDVEKIMAMFPDDEGLITFVSEIEKMKGEGGTVVGFSFATKDPVPDRTKNLGLPILILMQGSWEDIGRDIVKLQSLDYMFRPVSFTADESLEIQGMVDLQYGGFLYVDKSLEKNR